jgi:pimeloyl-ACP methyl ester carboxylesterase
MPMLKPEARGTFVLVHGAWAGSWCWARVVDRLSANGHRVFAPTLSGLGERSHLAACDINLTTHVLDVVNEITWKDLDHVILVGHSYGGMVINGVAEHVVDRIASIIYIDAFIPADGESAADLGLPEDSKSALIAVPPTAEGEYINEADRAWVDAKATPQPSATFGEKLHVSGAYQRVPNKVYIRASNGPSIFQEFAATARSDRWTVYEIESGHDVAIDAPMELCEILEACARQERQART